MSDTLYGIKLNDMAEIGSSRLWAGLPRDPLTEISISEHEEISVPDRRYKLKRKEIL